MPYHQRGGGGVVLSALTHIEKVGPNTRGPNKHNRHAGYNAQGHPTVYQKKTSLTATFTLRSPLRTTSQTCEKKPHYDGRVQHFANMLNT